VCTSGTSKLSNLSVSEFEKREQGHKYQEKKQTKRLKETGERKREQDNVKQRERESTRWKPNEE
jgi:hypothetical protein